MSEPKILKITAFFGDRQHEFSLHNGKDWALIRELEDKTKVGPMVVFRRLFAGEFRANDVREIIRLGPIGGGKTPSEAHLLVTRYVDLTPLTESAPIAIDVLSAALYGFSPAPEPTPEPEAA